MCKRKRPKFKVGDILEDYRYDENDDIYKIYHYMVMEVKYIPCSYLAKRKRKGADIKKILWVWWYTVKNMKTGRMQLFSCTSLDRYHIIKKVG
jgi:hypothetical protein